MKVRAKFTCISVKKYKSTVWNGNQASEGFLYAYEFYPVTGGSKASDENKSFFASTPSGELKMSAVRDDLFEPGKEYYLDFLPAEPLG